MTLATVGMLTHVALTGLTVYQPTQNPIWGELRLTLALITVVGLWAVLSQVLPVPAVEVTQYWPRRIA